MPTRSFVPRRAPFTWSPQAFYLTTLGMVISGAMSCNAWAGDAPGDDPKAPPAPDAPQAAVTLGPIKVAGANVE